MRKLFLFTVGVMLHIGIVHAQSIAPSILNASGGTAKLPNKNYYIDWSVGEMVLVNTMHNVGFKGLFIVTNGFLQPVKNNDDEDDDDYEDDKFLKPNPEYTNIQLRVYPNPASNYVMVEFPMQEAGKIRLTLFNSMGQIVYDKEITTYGHHTTERISMTPFMQGTYLLRVRTGSPEAPKEITYKIFKAN
jgi:Secretion system C-terminal sorting domain